MTTEKKCGPHVGIDANEAGVPCSVCGAGMPSEQPRQPVEDARAEATTATTEDVAIEAVARALYPEVMNTWEDQWPDWEHGDDEQKEFIRSLARTALTAAGPLSAPTRPSQAAIAHTLALSYGSHINPPKGGKDYRASDAVLDLLADMPDAAEVKAQALEEAAKAMPQKWRVTDDGPAAWLEVRAARIGKGNDR